MVKGQHSTPRVAEAQELKPYRFSLEQFRALTRMGWLKEDERLELVDGTIVVMSPVNPPHSACVKRLNFLFSTRLQARAIVSVQDPLQVGESELYPDIALLEPRADFYSQSDASASDALLVVEVSDSTLKYDQEVKVPLYAGAGVPEVWVVDLNAGRVWVYREPKEGSYTWIQAYERGAVLAVRRLPEVSLTVDEVLG
jgi:Uma2 family endonuclease